MKYTCVEYHPGQEIEHYQFQRLTKDHHRFYTEAERARKSHVTLDGDQRAECVRRRHKAKRKKFLPKDISSSKTVLNWLQNVIGQSCGQALHPTQLSTGSRVLQQPSPSGQVQGSSRSWPWSDTHTWTSPHSSSQPLPSPFSPNETTTLTSDSKNYLGLFFNFR